MHTHSVKGRHTYFHSHSLEIQIHQPNQPTNNSSKATKETRNFLYAKSCILFRILFSAHYLLFRRNPIFLGIRWLHYKKIERVNMCFLFRLVIRYPSSSHRTTHHAIQHIQKLRQVPYVPLLGLPFSFIFFFCVDTTLCCFAWVTTGDATAVENRFTTTRNTHSKDSQKSCMCVFVYNREKGSSSLNRRETSVQSKIGY